MIEIFLKLLKKIYDNKKKSDIKFKFKTWIKFWVSIQMVFLDIS